MIYIKKEFLRNIPTEFYVPMELVGLIKMCLNETLSGVRICLISFLSVVV
jgi:hypothetical protein